MSILKSVAVTPSEKKKVQLTITEKIYGIQSFIHSFIKIPAFITSEQSDILDISKACAAEHRPSVFELFLSARIMVRYTFIL